MQQHFNHIDPELLTKYLNKEVNEEEVSKVNEWIRSSSENRAYFEKLKKLWHTSEEAESFERIDVERDWQNVKSRINFQEPEKVKPLYSTDTQSYFRMFSRIAAVLVVITGISLFLYRLYVNKEIAVETVAGENKEVQLPDGSKVFLNSGSRITYLEDFTEDREVVLRGEAFFNVVRNEQSPFRVRTGNTITEVLGTSFNINEFQQKVVVTLVTGKVAFYTEEKETEKVVITKGEQAIYEKGNISRGLTQDKNVLAWKEKKILFEDENFENVVEGIENYFKVDIEVANSKLFNCKYTGTFENPDLQRVLNIVKTTLDATIEKQGDKYVFKGKGCEEISR